MSEDLQKQALAETVKKHLNEHRLRKIAAGAFAALTLPGMVAPEVAGATQLTKHPEMAAKSPEFTKHQEVLSNQSTVLIVSRPKGDTAGWTGTFSATKFNRNELLTARHELPYEASTNTGLLAPTVPNKEFPYMNYKKAMQLYDLAIADPNNPNKPLLPVTDISFSNKNDIAMLKTDSSSTEYSPDAPAEWSKLPVLNLKLAEKPPAINSPVLITSYHRAPSGKNIKMTIHGTYGGRDNLLHVVDGNPNQATPLDVVLVKKKDLPAGYPVASGSRAIFAGGLAGGSLNSYASFKESPGVLPELKRDIFAPGVNTIGDAGVFYINVLTPNIIKGLQGGFNHLAQPVDSSSPAPNTDPGITVAAP